MRITAQLVDATTGNHVWTDRYDRELEDIFAVQDEITESIIAAIGPELTLAEIGRTRQRRPEGLDAWDCYLRALPHMHRIEREANESAKRHFRQAIEHDPNFAAAHAWLAWCRTLDAVLGWSASTRDTLAEAFAVARTAVDLDADEPSANVVLSAVCSFTGRYEAAVATARRALELDPNLALAHGILGIALAFSGRAEEAPAAFERALRGSPRDPFRWAWFAGRAHAHFSAGRYEEAIEWEQRSIQLRPTWYGAHVLLAAAAAHLGRADEARRAAAALLRLVPRFTIGGAAKNPLFARPEDAKVLIAGLRKAGLPE